MIRSEGVLEEFDVPPSALGGRGEGDDVESAWEVGEVITLEKELCEATEPGLLAAVHAHLGRAEVAASSALDLDEDDHPLVECDDVNFAEVCGEVALGYLVALALEEACSGVLGLACVEALAQSVAPGMFQRTRARLPTRWRM